MNLFKHLKRYKAQQAFKARYLLLSEEEQEIIELLLIAPRSSCQLRNRGYVNPDSIVQRLKAKGWDISVTEHYHDEEREFKLEENPWE